MLAQDAMQVLQRDSLGSNSTHVIEAEVVATGDVALAFKVAEAQRQVRGTSFHATG